MSELFSRLRRTRQSEQQAVSVAFFQFMVCPGEKGVSVRAVDARLKDVDISGYVGDATVRAAAKTFCDILQKQSWQINWGKPSGSKSVSAADYPHFLHQLMRCGNIVDSKGNPLKALEEQGTVKLTLAAGDDGKFFPHFSVVAGEREFGDMRFLSDSFVIAGDNLMSVRPVGDNYDQLDVFGEPFTADMLEPYLSVAFSYLDNIELAYDDYEVRYSDVPVSTVPAILFDKVDSDKALFLHIAHTLPDMSMEFIAQFEPTRIACIAPGHVIELKPIHYSSLAESGNMLEKQIMQYAPDRSSRREIYREGNNYIIPAATASPFLLQGLGALLGSFRLLGIEKLKEYKLTVSQPKMRLSLSSGIDFLEGSLALEVGEQTFSLQELLRMYAKNKYIQLSDGNRAIINQEYVDKLQRLFRPAKGKTNKVQTSFFDISEIEEMLPEGIPGEVFEKHRRFYDGFNGLFSQELPVDEVKASLRRYQADGVKWLKYLYDNNLGGCLADDMGLGKTLQTITLLAKIYPAESAPTLIVMPRSLLFNWEMELDRFAPQLKHFTYYGPTRNFDNIAGNQIILTTYAIVRNDIDKFSKTDFHCVILDESQNIKNIGAQTTQAVYSLRAPHRFALSGTPVENNLTELYSLFHFLIPSMFGSPEEFNRRYSTPIQRDNDRELLGVLRRRIYPFMLRRLKKDVLDDLPDRIDNMLYVEMSDEQSRLYETRRRFYHSQVNAAVAAKGVRASRFELLQAVNELRQIASVPENMSEGRIASPKVSELVESLVTAVSNRHKAVVFFNFLTGIDLVGVRLQELGIEYVTMTGATHDRQSVVDRFQKDKKCKVLLMTLKTGGVGLNLTAADNVYIFEPWWNKAAEEQGVNRLHRIGQKSTVMCYSMITRGSIEEKIVQLQQKKSMLVDELISSDSAAGKTLSEEDIDFILG